jgi:hypothetical protein
MNSTFPPRSRLNLVWDLIGAMCIFSGPLGMRWSRKAAPAGIV